MKVFYSIIGVGLLLCGCIPKQIKDIPYTEIHRIIISQRIGTSDSINYNLLNHEVSDNQWIKKLFADYLLKSKQEPIKFYPSYKIVIIDKKKRYEIFVSGHAWKINGVSYKCKNNLERYIKASCCDFY